MTADTAYLLTFTTYGSWLHGDARGSHDREAPGGTAWVPPSPELERRARALMKEPAMTLDAAQRESVDSSILRVCQERGYDALALNVRTSHVHAVVVAEA